MNKEHNNTKLSNFRNTYSVIIGIPCVLFWNYTVFFAEDFWKFFIPYSMVTCTSDAFQSPMVSGFEKISNFSM